ncbi:hypothetical protein TRFO_33422 [Tritrichomonas foetus]|uniref:Transmembrane protein n=1 Tax=Tritrichomonas foetus TaxID=1144522 RepID=A0A1J4JR69_9EUKA|nr:hypothetical protein TRFO_33422 [Tritrichomonas foetus]|eukprot:OHT00004.1 hypothetical protein TRFO_33422 [Tritrichomonas foetus]
MIDNLRQEKDIDIAELTVIQTNPENFFCETASNNQFYLSIILFFCFLLGHVIVSIFAPPIISHHSQIYSNTAHNGNSTVDIDIKLSNLQNFHRFVGVNGSFYRSDKHLPSFDYPVTVSTRVNYLNNYSIEDFDSLLKKSYIIHFDQNSILSSSFPVLFHPINNFNSVQAKITIDADLSKIKDFNFCWIYGNPTGVTTSRIVRFIMSFLVFYFLMAFLYQINFESDKFIKISCIFVGFSAVFSVNPIAILLPESISAMITDSLMLSVFICSFRLFLFIQLDLIRTNKPQPTTFYLAGIVFLFSIYALIDVVAGFDRFHLINLLYTSLQTTLDSEKVLMCADFIYCVAVTVLNYFAFKQTDGQSHRRLIFLSIVTGVTVFATIFSHIFSQVFKEILDTIIPLNIFISFHTTSTAFIIFLMQGSTKEYQDIEDVPHDLDVDDQVGDFELLNEDDQMEAI